MLQLFLLSAPQGGGAGGAGSSVMSIVMMVAIIAIFYLFMIRPQMKRQKEAKKFREGLQKGDKVITIGGIYGKIAEVHDTHLLVEIDTNVKIKVDKSSVVANPSEIQQK